jgi:hypothetical protein
MSQWPQVGAFPGLIPPSHTRDGRGRIARAYPAPARWPAGKHSLITPPRSLSPRTTTSDDLPSRLANSARSSNAAYFVEQSCRCSIARRALYVSVRAASSPTAIATPIATIIAASVATLQNVHLCSALNRDRGVRALACPLIHGGPGRPASPPAPARRFSLMTSAPAPRRCPPSAPAPTQPDAARALHKQRAAQHIRLAGAAAVHKPPEAAAHTQPGAVRPQPAAAQLQPGAVRRQPASVQPRPSCCPSRPHPWSPRSRLASPCCRVCPLR